MTGIGAMTQFVNIGSYFATNFLLASAFESKKKRSTFIEACGLFLYSIVFVIVKCFWNTDGPVKYISLLGILISCFIYLHTHMEGSVGRKVLFLVIQEMTLFFGELTAMVAFNDIVMTLEVWDVNEPIVLLVDTIINIMGITYYMMVLFVWRKFVMKHNFDTRSILLFIFFPLGQIFLVASHNRVIFDIQSDSSIVLCVGIVIGLVGDFLLLATIIRQQRMKEMETKLAEVKHAWDLEKNHYEEIENRREELAKIRHDLTEQFILMRELMKRDDKEKVQDMLDTLANYVANTKEYVYCGDSVVNAIMDENVKICEEKGINLTYELDIPKELSMNPVAICSIFTNLFRNAIAAAEKVESAAITGDGALGESGSAQRALSEKQGSFNSARYVRIKAALKGEYLHIKEENSYNPRAVRKENRKGYGVEILHSLVEQHDGQMEVATGDGKYKVELSVENKMVEG